MGSYTFKWEHPANEVFVTGTFDDWKQTVKLEKSAEGVFEKTVELPATDKVLYKFVVDGTWTTNSTAASESDGSNENNVLHPSDLVSPATISSVAPGSSTAALAAEVPKETTASVPGGFPETPFETPAQEPQQFSVNPIPATEGPGNPIKLAAGEPVPDPSTLTGNTIESTVKRDEELEEGEKTVGVDPIPATEGLGNPITLAPGAPVPDLQKKDEGEQTVSVDPIPATEGLGNPIQLAPGEPVPEIVQENTNKEPNGMFGVPPVTSTLIPESSLPIGEKEIPRDINAGPTIQSASADSTTAALAGAVPKEPRGVPVVVQESQKEAHVEPEASAVAEAVEEKKEVEAELKQTIAEVPATTESTATETVASTEEVAAAVPVEVKESIEAAHAAPEAAVNAEAVAAKQAVESELKTEVSETNTTGEPAPTTTAATSETAPTPQKTEVSSNDEVVPAQQEPAAVLSATPSAPVLASADISPKTTAQDKPATAPPVEDVKPLDAPTAQKEEPAAEAPAAPTEEPAAKKPETAEATAAKKKKHRVSAFIKKLKEKF